MFPFEVKVFFLFMLYFLQTGPFQQKHLSCLDVYLSGREHHGDANHLTSATLSLFFPAHLWVELVGLTHFLGRVSCV